MNISPDSVYIAMNGIESVLSLKALGNQRDSKKMKRFERE